MVGTAKTATKRRERKPTDERMPKRRLFTIEEYLRLEQVGILHEDDPVELINGEIVLMAAQGSRHSGCISWLIAFFAPRIVGRAILSAQSTMSVPPRSGPEPDVVLLRYRDDFYRTRLADPDDVLLIIEVADTTLAYDCGLKRQIYEEGGIREFWIVDLQGERLIVHRGLRDGRYADVTEVGCGGAVSPLEFPDITLSVDEILG
jgi:Uma2 family endonuclease